MTNSHAALRTDDADRLEEIIADPPGDSTSPIGELLHYGAERLCVENGHLTRINVGLGTHTIAATSGPHPLIAEGQTSDLAATYCRKVLASGELCVVRDAPNEGWAEDPAYTSLGLATYLGAKVVVHDELYGTVCFVDTDPHDEPIAPADEALVRAIGEAIASHLEQADPEQGATESLNGPADLLRRIQSLAQIGGWELDPDTDDLTGTDELYRIFELPRDETLTVDTFLQFYDSDDRSRLQNALKACGADGTPFTLELPITTAQGHQRWVRTKGQPHSENGKIARVVGVDQDVTHEHELQERLSVSRSRLQSLVSHSKPVIFVLDRDGTVLLSEGEDLQSLDLSPGEVVGDSVFDLYADQPGLLATVEEALSGRAVDCEVEVDGVTFDTWYAPFYADEGDVAGCIGVAADVTEQREMETHLRKTRARLKALFEQNPVMINVHDGDGNILNPNPRLCQETGYDDEELTTMKMWELDASISPEQATALWSDMRVGDEKQLEGTYRRRDGSTFPVELHVRRLERDGDPQFMAIARNITEQKTDERRHKQIISRVTDAIVEVDADWRFTLVNEQAEALYDMDETDLLGKSFWDVFSAALDTRLERTYRRVMQTREPSRLTEYYSGLDGWFDIQIYPNEDGGLAFYFDDVTEQKERERRLEAVFNHTYQFTGLLAPDGTVLEANDTALALGGLDEADVLGKPLWETHWFQTGSDTKERLQSSVRRAADGEFVRYEETVQGTDGTHIIDFSLRALPGEDGDVTHIIAEGRDITEHKTAERELREERDLLKRILATSPAAITVLDSNGQFDRVSDRAREILGLEKDQVTDRTFNDPAWKITAADGSSVPEEELPFVRVKRTGKPVYDVEHAIEWPDGTRRLLSVSGAPLEDVDGAFMGAVLHLDDITERRRAKHELRESEQRFRGVFQNAGLGIALCSDDGTVQEANTTLERMLGFDRGQLAGAHFQDLTHPDDLETDQDLFGSLMAGNRESYQIEKRYLRRDGGIFWGRLTVTRQEGPGGAQVVSMVEDIDEEKQSKEELRKFKQVVEHAYDAVLITEGRPLENPGPRITYVNPAYTRTTGYDPEDILGKTPRIMQGPETEPWVLHNLRRQIEQGLPFEGEAINYKKDGTPFVNHWSISPVYDEDDTITHWVSVQRDVTEERRTGQRLLEVQDIERRRIDNEIHDELGGLLTSLQMTVDLARIQTSDENAVVDHLTDLEALIQEVSAVSRTISRQLHPSVLDDHGLHEALLSLAGEFRNRNDLEVELHNEVKPEERYSSLVEVTAYRVVQEALWNVVRHAETKDTQVVSLVGERQLHVHVFDDGIGFDPSAPFDAEKYGLEGIRRRVHRLNGTFEVQSEPGQGTRVSATLPLTISTLER